ncbi:hypothetical protein ACDQ55_09455 [Chitinophaga sp. 30R24]|uniref:hypothetical protein n=1 Tax=Chitinophaga sp. 30R24 TaxID=3248838 RepID=UPI003B8F21D0
MKKAKIALSAIAVLAVVGGAFAFKAALPVRFYVPAADGKCTLPTLLTYSTVPSTFPGATTYQLSTLSTTVSCPTTFIIIGD